MYITEIERLAAQLARLIYSEPPRAIFNAIALNANAVTGFSLAGETLYIAYRGTDDKTDALEDLQTGRKQTGMGHVRRGFYGHARKTYRAVRQQIEALNPKNIVFTGHSLGGAVANIHAVLVWQHYPHLQNTLQVVTFGAPRVFKPDLAEDMSDLLDGRITRFVKQGDPVPSVPPVLFWRHTRGLAYLADNDVIRDNVRPVNAVFRSTLNAIRGTVTRAKHHDMTGYLAALELHPDADILPPVSPTDGFEML